MTLQNFAFLALLIIFTSCSSGGGDDESQDNEASPLSSTITAFGATSDSEGKASLTFEVPEGVNKLSISAESLGNSIRFESVTSSNGTNYAQNDGMLLTTSIDPFPDIVAVNIPSRIVDPIPASTDSITAKVIVGNLNSSGSISAKEGLPVTFTVNTKADDTFDSGVLNINLFLVGPIVQITSNSNSIREALNIFKNIYSSQSGIEVFINEFQISGPASLPNPLDGSEFYLQSISGTPQDSINLFVGADVTTNFNGMAQVLGLAGGIPGPANASTRSIVAISILGSSGIDGEFNDSEIQILGETIAHEIGHYLGLFHPIELTDSFDIAGFDPLADTPTCSNLDECLENNNLISNNMFPTPVFSNDGRAINQQFLTGDQKGVMNRNILTN